MGEAYWIAVWVTVRIFAGRKDRGKGFHGQMDTTSAPAVYPGTFRSPRALQPWAGNGGEAY